MKTTTISLLALTAGVAAVPSDHVERAIANAPVERGFPDIEERWLNPFTNGPVHALSPEVISSWVPLAHYQAAAYCDMGAVQSWTCGEHCAAIGGKNKVVMTGGNDEETPQHYVVNNGSHLIVGIRGTSQSPKSLANDLNFFLTRPDEQYFPGIKKAGGKVHTGFYRAMTRVAATVAPVVQAEVKAGTTQVIVLGHSLGAAVGQLLGLYLDALLSHSATVETRNFATPRVGNPAYANYVDARMGSRQQHLQNYNDPFPHLPPKDWGFRHPSNEIFLPSAGSMNPVACTGQENKKCANEHAEPLDWLTSFVSLSKTDIHSGPYLGVMLHCK